MDQVDSIFNSQIHGPTLGFDTLNQRLDQANIYIYIYIRLKFVYEGRGLWRPI